MKTRLISILVITFITLAGATGCYTPTAEQTVATVTQTVTTTVTATLPPVTTGVPDGSIYDIEATLESLYAASNPSVVYIEVSYPMGGASGSGFIWDKLGWIVTNNHVVDGAEDITVIFYDGSYAEATLVGQDADSDLAVIQVDVDPSKLTPVTLADSTSLKVGQMVIAIGNPYGYQGTMTVGYISGLGRLMPVTENSTGPSYSIADVIQTDAAINPGNSGGVLLDTSGNVIGVTSFNVSDSGASAGVGFAIPSIIVQKVVPSLIKTGSYAHPYLGVTITSLTPSIAAEMGLAAGQRGALVQNVTAGGPADNASIRAGTRQVTIDGRDISVGGDLIIGYDGRVVVSSDDLITQMARYGAVGQTATFDILRDGQEIQLTVTLGTRPS